MMNFLWTALTVVLTVLLIFAISAFVVLAEYLQRKEAMRAKDEPVRER